MKNNTNYCEIAKRTLKTEAEGVLDLCKNIDDSFSKIINIILSLPGRVILTGIGKSAIIAQKIVSTLNSTGTPSIFMHAADAIHGDLGMIQSDDLVICISNSGNTPEIKILVPLLKKSGNKLIAMVGNTQSFLAQKADFILNTTILIEACPHNLAPTTSTTAQLAMGDALAVCLLEGRRFTANDFAKYHPGGSLGKKLYLKVGDLSIHNEKPQVPFNATIHEVLVKITQSRLGAVAVVKDDLAEGIITDGDIRRMLEGKRDISKLQAIDIMNPSPKRIEQASLAVDALEILQKNNINQILVLSDGKYAGIIHLHDLLKEGII